MNRRDIKIIAAAVAVVLAIFVAVVVVFLVGWAYDPSGDEPVGEVTTISTTR